jgi:hypothetical protein
VRWIIFVISAMIAGCATEQHPAQSRSSMQGIWDLILWRDSLPARDSTVGTMGLLSSASQSRRFGDTTRRMEFGVYDVSLGRWGRELPAGENLPPVRTVEFGNDSVLFYLHGDTDGSVLMRGRWSGDSLRGTWYLAVPGGFGGHFMMRRSRR